MQPDFPKPIEARAWLAANHNPSAFATNRFWTTDRAMAFVNALYEAGALDVLVDHILPDGADRDGGPYADTLIVKLPDDDERQWRIARLCEESGPGDVPEGDFRMTVRRSEIELWWD
jgi:hypothetical protein